LRLTLRNTELRSIRVGPSISIVGKTFEYVQFEKTLAGNMLYEPRR